MLKGISPLLSPDLLAVLARMGHGDTIVFADAHFPGDTFHNQVLRADGIEIAPLLAAVAPLFELDQYGEEPPLAMMDVVAGDTLDEQVEKDYTQALLQGGAQRVIVERVERFAFYEQTRSAFAVVMTGELRKYGNILLRKGVTPVE